MLVEKPKKVQIIDEFEIEGFQNCQQYLKINPISILITDPKFKINCCFMRMDINIDLLQIAFYLACQYKKMQTQFLLLQTDLMTLKIF